MVLFISVKFWNFIMSGIKIISFNNKAVDFSPFGLSSFFFIIMTFNYYIKINREKTIICLSSDKVEEWTRLPWFYFSVTLFNRSLLY